MKKNNTTIRLLEKEIKRLENDTKQIEVLINQTQTTLLNHKIELKRIHKSKVELEQALKDINA
jgi:septal ring factor EnvC (AmiA/AmiB activator)